MTLVPWPPDPEWLGDSTNPGWFVRAGSDYSDDDNWNYDLPAWEELFHAPPPPIYPPPPPGAGDDLIPDFLKPILNEARSQLARLGSWFAQFSFIQIIQAVINDNTLFVGANPIGVAIRTFGPHILDLFYNPPPPPPIHIPPPPPVIPVPSGDEGIENAALAAIGVWPSRDAEVTMVAIAGAESHWVPQDGDPVASYPLPDQDHAEQYSCGGYTSFGIWQINLPANHATVQRLSGLSDPCSQREWLYDIVNNARAAEAIANSQGYGAWTTYVNSSYAAYLTQAGNTVDDILAGHHPPPIPGDFQAEIDALAALLSTESSDRQAADTTISTNLGNSIVETQTALSDGLSALNQEVIDSVGAEAQGRVDADTTISTNLSAAIIAEETERAAQDVNLQTAIDDQVAAEAQARYDQITAVQATLSDDINRGDAATLAEANALTVAQVTPIVDWIHYYQDDIDVLDTVAPVLKSITADLPKWLCATLVTLPVACWEELLLGLWDGTIPAPPNP